MTRRSRRSNRSRSRSRSRNRSVIIGVTILATAIVVVLGAAMALRQLRGSDDGGIMAAGKTKVLSLGLQGRLGPIYAGDLVAAGAGLFEQEGLRVNLKPGGTGAALMASVVAGDTTFGVTDSIGFMKARASGTPIVAFAAGYLESGIVFYVLESAHILAPQDFIGRRIGRQPGTNAAVIYDALMKETGLSRSGTRESATEAGLDALVAGKVDVIAGRVGQEAFVLRNKSVPYGVISASNYGIHVPDTVYIASEQTIRDRPELVQRFLKAVIAGWTMTIAAPEKTVPLIVRAAGNGFTPAQVRFELAAQRDFVKPLARRVAEYDNRQWKQLRDILVGARLIDGSIDLSRAINYDFLKEAYRKPITFGN